MIGYRQLQTFAAEQLASPSVHEVNIRRAISAIYYGLFHRLTAAGASVFQGGGATLTSRVARAYSHSGMLEICKAYVRSHKGQLASPLDQLLTTTPDSRLIALAALFMDLQEARNAADYDVTGMMKLQQGSALLERADEAHRHLDDMAGHPQTIIFLTALLLHGSWKRRG